MSTSTRHVDKGFGFQVASAVMVVVGMTAAAGGYEVEGGDVVCDVPDLGRRGMAWRSWWPTAAGRILAGGGAGSGREEGV
ncbi:hypothetical protein Tco_0414836 [Tanacetum coccineum]